MVYCFPTWIDWIFFLKEMQILYNNSLSILISFDFYPKMALVKQTIFLFHRLFNVDVNKNYLTIILFQTMFQRYMLKKSTRYYLTGYISRRAYKCVHYCEDCRKDLFTKQPNKFCRLSIVMARPKPQKLH